MELFYYFLLFICGLINIDIIISDYVCKNGMIGK